MVEAPQSFVVATECQKVAEQMVGLQVDEIGIQRAALQAQAAAAAAQVGVRAGSPGFVLLNGWLCCRPHRTLIRTWKDYIAAIQKFLSPEAYKALRLSTVNRARTVAEASGGVLGFLKVSRAEEDAIQELNLAFGI